MFTLMNHTCLPQKGGFLLVLFWNGQRTTYYHDNCRFLSPAGVSPNFASQFSKNPPPRTPDKCDPDLSFDAVTELQQEVLFFKGRYDSIFVGQAMDKAWQTWCWLEHHSNCDSHSAVSDLCGANIPSLKKLVSLWSAACGPTVSPLT